MGPWATYLVHGTPFFLGTHFVLFTQMTGKCLYVLNIEWRYMLFICIHSHHRGSLGVRVGYWNQLKRFSKHNICIHRDSLPLPFPSLQHSNTPILPLPSLTHSSTKLQSRHRDYCPLMVCCSSPPPAGSPTGRCNRALRLSLSTSGVLGWFSPLLHTWKMRIVVRFKLWCLF